ncbi:MAG: hypothetical protein ACO3JL_17960, partial [Myxococcota bacterium]
MKARGLLACGAGLCVWFTVGCAGPRGQSSASRGGTPSATTASMGAQGTRVDVYVTQEMSPRAEDPTPKPKERGEEELMGRLPPSQCPVERGASVTLHRVKDMPAIDFTAAE